MKLQKNSDYFLFYYFTIYIIFLIWDILKKNYTYKK